MSDVRYAPYHRPGDETPDPAKLKALADGYFGLNWVFLVNVAMVVPMNILMMGDPMTQEAANAKGLMALGWIVVIFLTISTLTYLQNRKIGFGLDWSPATVIAVSILMGINSALCCGVIGYAIVQTIASNRMAKVYQVKLTLFNGKRRVDEKVRELEQLRANPPSAPPPTFNL